MGMTLYELRAADPARRFSPYCWRTLFALAHKGLMADRVPLGFTDIPRTLPAGNTRVPVLVDDGRVVADSWAIAEYLDTAYPDRPTLLGGNAAHLRLINAWADTILHPAISRLVVGDVLAALDGEDATYFRTSRERAYGTTLAAVVAGREQRVEAFRALLAPLRAVLRVQPWLGGAAPDYADYIVLGTLQWPRGASPLALLAADDAVAEWQARGLALFGGLGAAQPRAA